MHQAKTSPSRLVERALAGEDVVIARNGQPHHQARTRQAHFPADPETTLRDEGFGVLQVTFAHLRES